MKRHRHKFRSSEEAARDVMLLLLLLSHFSRVQLCATP